eukprot:TRINITY_DN21162_c0_g1_i1.p2 TRINITY_DN21162_c0_g1~~TRINITY_DN21162_c0_g1_i1.p2  ORF type:complete len:238 (+),score=87.88 TRINITY_DN21162_c0_g1_i1:57-770(+)
MIPPSPAMPTLLDGAASECGSEGPPSLASPENDFLDCSMSTALSVASVNAAAAAAEGQLLTCTLQRTREDEKLGAWIRGNALTNIAPGSPAERAGLAVGMKILEVDGVAVPIANTSAVVSTVWKQKTQVTLRIEAAVSRSKRSLAKARARQRQRAHSGISNVSAVSAVSHVSTDAPLSAEPATPAAAAPALAAFVPTAFPQVPPLLLSMAQQQPVLLMGQPGSTLLMQPQGPSFTPF